MTNEQPIKGTVHSNYTMNYTPWGLDNQIPIGSSLPGTISTGKPSVNNGAGVQMSALSAAIAVPFPPAPERISTRINNGIGPLDPSSAATLNWATLTEPANQRHE